MQLDSHRRFSDAQELELAYTHCMHVRWTFSRCARPCVGKPRMHGTVSVLPLSVFVFLLSAQKPRHVWRCRTVCVVPGVLHLASIHLQGTA